MIIYRWAILITNNVRCLFQVLLKYCLHCDDANPETYLTPGPKRISGKFLGSPKQIYAETKTFLLLMYERGYGYIFLKMINHRSGRMARWIKMLSNQMT